MKKLFKLIALAAAAIVGFSGCSLFYEESVDTIVEWGFSEKEDSDIVFGLEALLPSAQTIFEAFDEVFVKAGDQLSSNRHEIVLRAQKSQKKALANAKKLAEQAAAKLPAGHTCPVDYIFVVNITYGASGAPKTAWSHDYRK